MKHAERTISMGWYQRKAHEEVDHIFQKLLPRHGLKVREEQLRLSHEMLDTLWGEPHRTLRRRSRHRENICIPGGLYHAGKI